ncbi:hypothetical protein PHYSODRAFT_339291 [Phytophthora sojae]|uniref:Uncharacterized protein n=1 Tax=Phytophthora sojae (strain P6497) TaxID=1094619 RepID=G5A6B3_PHYSP|nr:hypothetical protein PHYSODRAFT_339291 [Phytophthora sojae]EGZ08868.1 hypothetical protein PHYSODRAFT_339291 [Phytophthora sojae]|eukprot:XP_009535501.1 hypothetical protein PHYSODRAFT_339291 [Phytophthora sojae]
MQESRKRSPSTGSRGRDAGGGRAVGVFKGEENLNQLYVKTAELLRLAKTSSEESAKLSNTKRLPEEAEAEALTIDFRKPQTDAKLPPTKQPNLHAFTISTGVEWPKNAFQRDRKESPASSRPKRIGGSVVEDGGLLLQQKRLRASKESISGMMRRAWREAEGATQDGSHTSTYTAKSLSAAELCLPPVLWNYDKNYDDKDYYGKDYYGRGKDYYGRGDDYYGKDVYSYSYGKDDYDYGYGYYPDYSFGGGYGYGYYPDYYSSYGGDYSFGYGYGFPGNYGYAGYGYGYGYPGFGFGFESAPTGGDAGQQETGGASPVTTTEDVASKSAEKDSKTPSKGSAKSGAADKSKGKGK